ncbi:MAG: hypothetical protein AAGA20_07980 [Planctomycetota bacterium]
MAETKRIGLSLGADICWPRCFEGVLRSWNPTLRVGGEDMRFEVDRVTIEPFDLRGKVRYDVVLDRLTHWYANTREWIKKGVLMDDLYVLNNPWSVQSMEKQTSYCAMMRLGMPIPDTWLVPPKEYEDQPDLQKTLEQYARFFDLEELGASVGYPHFMKPYDGGGWVGVTKIDDGEALKSAYEESGKFVMHLQKGVLPHDHFVRCIGIGPDVRIVEYDPTAPLHERYTTDHDHLPARDAEHLRAVTLTINAFFGWDFNSCECLHQDGVWAPIDFANPCPDSQVTSLNRHFPWMVLGNLRWAIFNAATNRRFRVNLDWQPFFDVADGPGTFEEKLSQYAAIAAERFDTAAFEEFSEEHLGPLDEVAWEFFGSEEARDAVHEKVVALFPENEVEEFTELFWGSIQDWRLETAQAGARTKAAPDERPVGEARR